MNELPYYLVGGTESLFGVHVSDIQRAFVRQIQSYLPDNPVHWVSLKEVQRGLASQVALAEQVVGAECFVITLSALYFNTSDGEVCCTRVVDGRYQKLGIIGRPGSESVKKQVCDLMNAVGQRKVIVVDDTLFHGDTIRLLRGFGLRVDAVVEYFTATEAAQSLLAEGIQVFSALTLDGYLDVMPLHDFLPTMPLCGKLVGRSDGIGGVVHLGSENGRSWSFPYLYPFVPRKLVTSWASIPYPYVTDFSAFALQQTTILAERLKDTGICTLQDMKDAQPYPVSLPFLGSMPGRDDMSLHEILRRTVHHCMV